MVTTVPTCPTHQRAMKEFQNDDGTTRWKCTAVLGEDQFGKKKFCRESWRPQAPVNPPGRGWTRPAAPPQGQDARQEASRAPGTTFDSSLAIEAEARREAVQAASRVFAGSGNGDAALAWAERFLQFMLNEEAQG